MQLSANSGTRPFITFLLVTGRLHPGWDYLVHRKFSSLWRDVPGTAIGADLQTFITGARSCGYTERVASAMASQVIARLLFATGKPLAQMTHDDFAALTAAGIARQEQTGRTWKHYRGTATGAKRVLFHLGILPALPVSFEQRWPFARRLAAVPEPMHTILVRYLQHKAVTCRAGTVSSLATRLAAFGSYLAGLDPAATPANLAGVATSNSGCPASPPPRTPNPVECYPPPSRPAGSWPWRTSCARSPNGTGLKHQPGHCCTPATTRAYPNRCQGSYPLPSSYPVRKGGVAGHQVRHDLLPLSY